LCGVNNWKTGELAADAQTFLFNGEFVPDKNQFRIDVLGRKQRTLNNNRRGMISPHRVDCDFRHRGMKY
jgi:hypothetical protein